MRRSCSAGNSKANLKRTKAVTLSVSVIGAGAWGTALSIVLADAGGQVALFGRDEAQVAAINATACNEKYLPDLKLPGNISAYRAIVNPLPAGGMVLIALPFQHARQVLKALAPNAGEISGVIWASKGIEQETHALAHEIVAAELGEELPFAMLSGPNFAKEVARRLPAAVTVASKNPQFLKAVCEAFHTDYFRPYSSEDVIGVEIGGAVKNVVAIAAGIADGLSLGANARAALITRGLAEIARWGKFRGGRSETFMGLSGLGDLVLTCTDDLSRNRRFGLQLARGKSIDEAIELVGLVEGAKTSLALAEVCANHGVDMPISSQVAGVVRGEISPQQAVSALMSRDLSTES